MTAAQLAFRVRLGASANITQGSAILADRKDKS